MGSGNVGTRSSAQTTGQAQTRAPASAANGQRGSWMVLAVVLVGSFMAVLDTTIVNVALPTIAVGTHGNQADLEWVVSGYALAFGLALVPAGRLGDRFGYKPLFLAGLCLFTLASLGCGLASGPALLIGARVLQGLGAGIYYPAISATIQRQFAGRDRSRAFGYLGGVVGLSTAIGPLLGARHSGGVAPHAFVRGRAATRAAVLRWFTSLFFTLSIAWQQGLGRSALATGLLIVPFAVGSLVTASLSDKFSHRFGSWTVRAVLPAAVPGPAAPEAAAWASQCRCCCTLRNGPPGSTCCSWSPP